MNTISLIVILSCLVISFSLVNSLECITCVQKLIVIGDVVPCQNKTDGAIPCEDKVCSMMIRGNDTVERGCSEKDVCNHVENGTVCGTCTSDRCIPSEFSHSSNSGNKDNAIFVPVIAGLILIIMGS